MVMIGTCTLLDIYSLWGSGSLPVSKYKTLLKCLQKNHNYMDKLATTGSMGISPPPDMMKLFTVYVFTFEIIIHEITRMFENKCNGMYTY